MTKRKNKNEQIKKNVIRLTPLPLSEISREDLGNLFMDAIHYITSLQNDIRVLEKKLNGRNKVKPEQLRLYYEIIKQIVKCETLNIEPNIQKICIDIKKTDPTLRQAFDEWIRRNEKKQQGFYEIQKAIVKNQFPEYFKSLEKLNV